MCLLSEARSYSVFPEPIRAKICQFLQANLLGLQLAASSSFRDVETRTYVSLHFTLVAGLQVQPQQAKDTHDCPDEANYFPSISRGHRGILHWKLRSQRKCCGHRLECDGRHRGSGRLLCWSWHAQALASYPTISDTKTKETSKDAKKTKMIQQELMESPSPDLSSGFG